MMKVPGNPNGMVTRPATIPRKRRVSHILIFRKRRDRGAAKTFLQKALSNPDHRTPRLLCMDGCRIYPAAIRDLRAEGRLPQRCRRRTKRYANNRIESDHRQCQTETPCHAGPTNDADGASSDSRHRSRTHDTESPIAGIPENESGYDLDRRYSLIEDRLIRPDWFDPLSLHRWSGLQHFHTTRSLEIWINSASLVGVCVDCGTGFFVTAARR